MYIPGFELQEKHYTAWVAEKFLALSIFMIIAQKCTICYILFPNDSSFPYDNRTIYCRTLDTAMFSVAF